MQAYDIPALDSDLKLAKGNLAPHTIMRGPGYLQAVMVIEKVPPFGAECKFETSLTRVDSAYDSVGPQPLQTVMLVGQHSRLLFSQIS